MAKHGVKRKKSPTEYRTLTYGIRPAPSVPTHITISLGIDAERWTDEGMWVPMISSNVSQIMFDKTTSQLFVQFDSGRTWRYDQVPRSVAMMMFWVNSPGVFTHRVLKGKYSSTEVTGAI